MKIHYLLLSTVLFTLSTLKLSGQTNKPCNNFDCAYKKAETFLKQAAYQKVLDNLDSAEGYLTDTNTKEKEQIKQLRRRLFVAIEKEKEDAKRARDEAKRQTEIAKNALAQVEIEKQTAIAAEKKAKAVLNKIYFYMNKYGLAFDGFYYGFIDKDLNTTIKFKYLEALPFNHMGFAKVNDGNTDFLIDTLSKEYKLATRIESLDKDVLALDLSFQNLKEIPKNIFNNKQLKILILDNNQIHSIPKEIENLNSLTFLSLSRNFIDSLPIEFGKLSNLSYLDLNFNSLIKVPVEFSQLSNLRDLSLGFNELSTLPKEFENCQNIESLNLGNNKFRFLDFDISKLYKLKNFYIYKCKLQKLPNSITDLKNLKFLNLSENPISKEEQQKIKALLPNCEIEF